jgi:hypothetical protein
MCEVRPLFSNVRAPAPVGSFSVARLLAGRRLYNRSLPPLPVPCACDPDLRASQLWDFAEKGRMHFSSPMIALPVVPSGMIR